jgi:hypothetical protein
VREPGLSADCKVRPEVSPARSSRRSNSEASDQGPEDGLYPRPDGLRKAINIDPLDKPRDDQDPHTAGCAVKVLGGHNHPYKRIASFKIGRLQGGGIIVDLRHRDFSANRGLQRLCLGVQRCQAALNLQIPQGKAYGRGTLRRAQPRHRGEAKAAGRGPLPERLTRRHLARRLRLGEGWNRYRQDQAGRQRDGTRPCEQEVRHRQDPIREADRHRRRTQGRSWPGYRQR